MHDKTERAKEKNWPDTEAIHAYVDGRLSPSERLRMERVMAKDPEILRLVQSFEQQNRDLRELFGADDVTARPQRKSNDVGI